MTAIEAHKQAKIKDDDLNETAKIFAANKWPQVQGNIQWAIQNGLFHTTYCIESFEQRQIEALKLYGQQLGFVIYDDSKNLLINWEH